MNTSIIFNKKTIFAIIFILYVFLPTNNSSLDAFAYAGYTKYNYNLFTPHHLFSNAIIYILLLPFKLVNINIDTLTFSKIINSLFQLFNLFIFFKLLGILKIKEKKKLLYILALAFSFSLWRYGTENETYIIPITFSLLGSYFFLKNITNNCTTNILASSLFGVFACLFHQIHFFWWLGILIGFYIYTKNIKTIFQYILPAILVPISYVLVLKWYEQQEVTLFNIQHFVLHDFYKGTVMSNFGWKGIFFQILNTVRTYFQIHPNIYILIKTNWIYLIPIISFFIISYISFIKLRKATILSLRKQDHLKTFINIHVLIFILNYLFAFYNYGNIEFMVMLPFLLCLCIATKYVINDKLILTVSILLFIWNFSYGIFPNYKYNYYNDQELVNYMIHNKEKTFIIKRATVLNEYFYKTGIDNPKNILLLHKTSNEKLSEIINEKKEVYTDVLNKPTILNKEKMTAQNSLTNFSTYSKELVFSYVGFYGKSSIYKISKH